MTIDKNTPSAINEGDGVWAKQEGETDDEILKTAEYNMYDSVEGITSSGSNYELGEDHPISWDKNGEPPRDKWLICLIEAALLGISVLILFNAVITAYDWFTLAYSHYATAWPFLASFSYNLPQIFVMLAAIKWGPQFSFTVRIAVPLVVFAFSLVAMPLFSALAVNASSTSQLINMSALLVLNFVSGMMGALMFGTILGLTACFPGIYTTACMSGMGIGGVLVGLLRIITKASFPEESSTDGASDSNDDAFYSTIIYFGAAALCVVITFIGYFVMIRTAFCKFYLDRYYSSLRQHQEQSKKITTYVDAEMTKMDRLKSQIKEQGAYYFAIFKKIWVHALSVYFVFFVTLTVFPGVTGGITPSYTNAGWFAVLYVFEFNLFDFIGRTSPMIRYIHFPQKFLWIVVIARVVFFPIFLLCVYQWLFDNDYWYYSWMALFAVSNGYCGTLAMMYGPSNVDTSEAETAGIIMSFFLQSGIFCAVWASLIFIPIFSATGVTA